MVYQKAVNIMTDFAMELENYLPQETKHIIRSDAFLVSNPLQYGEAVSSLSEGGEIYCRTITGSECLHTKCVGFCWNEIHRGYLTKKQMEQHQCLERNCYRFEKIETAPYWNQVNVQKRTRKNGKQAKKQLENDAEEFLQNIRKLTVHDCNFYPIAAELKDNTYEIRIITFKSVDYSQYLALFSHIAKGKKMHFTKIKADSERKQQIIDKHNIIKIALHDKPVKAEEPTPSITVNKDSENPTSCSFVKSKFECIIKYIKSLFSKGDQHGKR